MSHAPRMNPAGPAGQGPTMVLPEGIAKQRMQESRVQAIRFQLIGEVLSQLASVDYSHALHLRDEQVLSDREEAAKLGQEAEFPPEDYEVPQLGLQCGLVAEVAVAYADHLLEHLGLIQKDPARSTESEIPRDPPPPHPMAR